MFTNKTLFLLLLLSGFSLAQVLQVRVSIQDEHMPAEEQEILADLPEKIEQYYNNYEWVEDEFETDVICNVNIIIETVQKKTFEKLYKAQFLISSNSGENFYDKTWEFPYDQNTPLEHTMGQFDPLAHFLDYYAYLVLAGELDTYELLLGNPLYDKALDISSQGMLSQYTRGWATRNEDLLKITDVRTRPLREAKPNFFEALYLYDEGNYIEAGKFANNVFEAIKKVYTAQPNNKYLRIFFEAHHKELAALFSGNFDKLDALITFDSKHRETYRKYLPKE